MIEHKQNVKKICIITSSYPQGKDERATSKDFALLLKNKNYEVFVIAPKRYNKVSNDKEIKVKYISWPGSSELPLSAHNPKNPLHLIKLFGMIFSGVFVALRFLKKNEIDYCFALWAVPSGIFAYIGKIFLGIPYSSWTLGSDIWKIGDYPLGRKILKIVLKNSEKIYSDGFELAEQTSNIAEKKCAFLASNRLFDQEIIDIPYKKFDFTKKNFIFVGRYHKNKGVDLLVNAISLLTEEEKTKSLFHIFGMTGPEENNIKKLVIKLGLTDIIFINNAIPGEHVFSYMKKADYVVIPSRVESIPVVFSNAIQSSKPLIVTDVGDMGMLVNKYHVGFVCKPNSKSIKIRLSDAISKNIHDEEYAKGQNDLIQLLDLEKSVKIFIKDLPK